jgi:DNA-binding transcriptional regulator LsrR (DeoR family)
MTPTQIAQSRRMAVLDTLQQHPEGLSAADIARQMGVRLRVIRRDIRRLRRDVSVDNIPAVPNGHRQPWLYFLTNEAQPNEAWAKNRVADMESRFLTQIGQAKTMVRVTNGRTVEGRKARKIERTLEYLMRELDEIADNRLVPA